jgi:hypothetical protein
MKKERLNENDILMMIIKRRLTMRGGEKREKIV